MRKRIVLLVFLLLVVASSAQRVIWLGEIGTQSSSLLYDISPDGQWVVGVEFGSGGVPIASQYPFTSILRLNIPQMSAGFAKAVHTDSRGVVIAGEYIITQDGNSHSEAFWWRPDEHTLGILGTGCLCEGVHGQDAQVYGVRGLPGDDDFQVLGSSSYFFEDIYEFRISAVRFLCTPLFCESEPRRETAYAVSHYGPVVIAGGSSMTNPSGPPNGFVWHETLGLVDTGTPMMGVAADGSMAVGSGAIWTPENGVESLPGPWNDVATTSTGCPEPFRIVGGSFFDDSSFAVLYRYTDGAENLDTRYPDLITDGSSFSNATGISADGRYIVGWGWNGTRMRTEGFILDLCRKQYGDANCDLTIDDSDLLQVLFRFGDSCEGECPEDFNEDGVIDDADLLIALFNFGS